MPRPLTKNCGYSGATLSIVPEYAMHVVTDYDLAGNPSGNAAERDQAGLQPGPGRGYRPSLGVERAEGHGTRPLPCRANCVITSLYTTWACSRAFALVDDVATLISEARQEIGAYVLQHIFAPGFLDTALTPLFTWHGGQFVQVTASAGVLLGQGVSSRLVAQKP